MTNITEILEELSATSNGTDEPIVANRRRRLAKFFEGEALPAQEKSFLWQQEAESIGILAEHPDDGLEGLERARKRIGSLETAELHELRAVQTMLASMCLFASYAPLTQ